MLDFLGRRVPVPRHAVRGQEPLARALNQRVGQRLAPRRLRNFAIGAQAGQHLFDRRGVRRLSSVQPEHLRDAALRPVLALALDRLAVRAPPVQDVRDFIRSRRAERIEAKPLRYARVHIRPHESDGPALPADRRR